MQRNVQTIFLKGKLWLLTVIFLAAGVATATAQTDTPFGCNGSYYVTYGVGVGPTASTSIDKIVYNGSGISKSFVGTANSYGFNGADINPVDGYMYGIRYSNLADVQLLRIDANVNVDEVGTLPPIVSSQENIYSGCFDSNGDYYIGNIAAPGVASSIFKVNVSTADAVLLGSTGIQPETASGQLFLVDIAIDPSTGIMYGASSYCCGEGGENSRSLFTIDKVTGAATRIAQFHTESGYSTTGYGLFFAGNGDLFLYGTDAIFYHVDKTTGEISSVGNGSAYTFADACGCSYRINHLLRASAAAICLPNAASTTPFTFTEALINNRGTAIAGAGYYLELDKRFQFTQTAEEIKTLLTSLGVADASTVVTISGNNGGTNNVVDISPINIPSSGPGTEVNFVLNTLFTNTLGVPTINVASRVYNLPSILGDTELSDNPATLTPADSTSVSICDNGTLPVTFVGVTAFAEAQGKVSIQWQIENQVNIVSYKVERSTDGINFISVGNVKAGNVNKYALNDASASLLSGKVFYRVISIDASGKQGISKIATAVIGSSFASTIAISPNPFRNDVNLELLSPKQQIAIVNIYGVDGKLYQTHKLSITKGISQNVLQNTSKLRTGTYSVIVNLTETGEVVVRKVVKN